MKILILTENQSTSVRLENRFDIQGHESDVCSDWNEVTDKLENGSYNIVFVGSEFLVDNSHKASLIRNIGVGYIYVVGIGLENCDEDLRLGFNASLPKFFEDKDIDVATDIAVEFILKMKKLGNDNEDFPSSGGVISKSAFNQLFLSALDRTARYKESSYALFFCVENYKAIIVESGEDSAKHAAARLSHHLSKTRRQSDILGQIADNEYAILFLRPEYKEEPYDAASRFYETLSRIRDYVFSSGSVDISLKLMELPSGNIAVEHSFSSTPQ